MPRTVFKSFKEVRMILRERGRREQRRARREELSTQGGAGVVGRGSAHPGSAVAT